MSATVPPSDDLRAAFRDREPGAATRHGCPESDRIWVVLEGRAGGDERTRLIEHTGSCPACAEVWRLANRMGAMEERDDQIAPAPWRRWGTYVAIAATLILVSGLVLQFGLFRETSLPIYRAGEAGAIQSLVAEDAPQSRKALRLRWSSVGEGALYNLRVTTEAFEPVFTIEGLEETESLVPVESLGQVTPGTRLLWQVEAFPPDGSRVISDTFFVTIE